MRWFSWLTPPPAGRVIVLLIYWAIIIYMMTKGAVIHDFNFWERIGFRNAWVTVMQVPVLYLLSSRASILGLFAGTSYERLNWFHRWVARTIFVTASVHGWHFYTEYAIADMFDDMVEMMPMIKYGLGAWGVLLWTLVSSFVPIRSMAYEVFVLQHIISAVIFLWLVYVHIPEYARYNVWLAIAALCFDRVYRIILLVWQNVKFRPNMSRCNGGQRIGHHAQLRSVGDSITVVTVKDVHFRWRAGQHLYLWMPKVGLLETHPYTIACAHQLPETCICNSIQLVVRKHDGFSRRLHNFAAKAEAAGRKEAVTVFVSGPYGLAPKWDIYETLILISASTGASFTLPILESVLQAKRTICTKRIDFLLAAKQGDEIDFYVRRLHELIEKAKNVGIELSVHIAVTRGASLPGGDTNTRTTVSAGSSGNSSSAAIGKEATEKAAEVAEVAEVAGVPKVVDKTAGVDDIENAAAQQSPARRLSSCSTDSHVVHLDTRPDIEAFIRGPVEATGGETSVIACGGKSLAARVRNCVASLSDERAVHKGTGAQGIHLHVEEYCF